MLRAVGLKKDWDSLHSWWSAYVGLEEEVNGESTGKELAALCSMADN